MKQTQTQHQPKRYGMAIDLDKCTGCGSCMVACFAENNVPFKAGRNQQTAEHHLAEGLQDHQPKKFPHTEVCYIPRPCQHCAGQHEGHSPCVSVCPATATDYSIYTGIVSQIYTRCFGCRYCMAACPYHVRYFNWWDPVWPGHGKIPEPQCVAAHARGGGKMQLLLPPLPAGQEQGLHRGQAEIS
jgi:menaquinone reductase, iron-sulfur cluster-binding subunit